MKGGGFLQIQNNFLLKCLLDKLSLLIWIVLCRQINTEIIHLSKEFISQIPPQITLHLKIHSFFSLKRLYFFNADIRISDIKHISKPTCITFFFEKCIQGLVRGFTPKTPKKQEQKHVENLNVTHKNKVFSFN